MLAVEHVLDYRVTKAEGWDILHHLLSKVVVDTECLVLSPHGLDLGDQLAAALEVAAKGLFDNNAVRRIIAVNVAANLARN